VKLTYYISYLPEILMTSAVTIFGLLNGFRFYGLILSVPLLFQLIARINSQKRVSEDLLKNITG
jgi:hypothetical protein